MKMTDAQYRELQRLSNNTLTEFNSKMRLLDKSFIRCNATKNLDSQEIAILKESFPDINAKVFE